MKIFLTNNKINFFIKTSTTIVFAVFLFVSCNKETPEKIAAVVDRAALPQLHASDITTIISDSGITRYRIFAPCWDVYDKAIQPYWDFPNGIHFEKFNLELKVDANIHSQYARFNENQQLWELRGKVRATNLQGDLFETEQLFWDQRVKRIYSDSLIKITQISHIITGIGFESNEAMTSYTIRKPQGIFPVTEETNAAAPLVANPTPTSLTSPTKPNK